MIERFLANASRNQYQLALSALIVFELFSVNIDNPHNYDSVPYNEQLPMSPPALVRAVKQDDNNGQPFRVDAWRGLYDNRGSIYEVMDIRGISPLILKGPDDIIYANYVDNPPGLGAVRGEVRFQWRREAIRSFSNDWQRTRLVWSGPICIDSPIPAHSRAYIPKRDVVDSDQVGFGVNGRHPLP